jgi:hypothetical protein
MKAKVLVRVDRDAAVEAIRTLDALSAALQTHEPRWSKRLRRQYEQTRHDLVSAAGWWAHCNGVTDFTVID